jgi:chemotaxis protein MotA
MLPIIGIVILFATVFGGYILAGGKMGIILHALPHELLMIFGAAVAAMVIGTPGNVMKSVGGGLGKAFKGAKWKKQDYEDLLCLLFLLCKLMRTKGMMAVEQHIENPEASSIFSKYPSVQHDHHAVDLICDTLRMMTMALDDPHQVEDMIEKKLEKHHHEVAKAAEVLQGMADGLPALGIVAAVLGVIKTMASIDQPPPILGAMIGGALVGTFLGVFLAYGLAGPLATKLGRVNEEEAQFYAVIRDVIVAHLQGNAPQISLEVGRGSVPSHLQPTFQEMEQASSVLKVE